MSELESMTALRSSKLRETRTSRLPVRRLTRNCKGHRSRDCSQPGLLSELIQFPKLQRPGAYPWLAADSGLIPRSRIRAFCAAVGREFQPEKIILFGSYGYGKPTPDSDVDLMVIMPYRGRSTKQVVKICSHVRPPFPMDILVWKPEYVKKRIAWNCWFTKEVLARGKVMYEAGHK